MNDATPARKRTIRTLAPVDRHVAGRIRERRIQLGFSQQQFADQIGVTYQQAHKYERGINRVGASRLWDIARVLSVPVDYFHREYKDERPEMPLSPKQRKSLELLEICSKIAASGEKSAQKKVEMASAAARDWVEVERLDAKTGPQPS